MRSWLASLALALTLTEAASAALADDWPSRPIRVIVPFTAGGAADVSARVVGAKLGETLHQPLVVENRAGSGGILALELAKNAPADGYTLVILANSNATKPATIPNLPWNLERDFSYIAVTVDSAMVLVGNPDKAKAANLAELTAALKSGTAYSYGSCGIASTQHFAMEKYRYYTQAVAQHVPYKGCAVATPDVLSGQVELAMISLSNALPYIKSGKLRAYGVTTSERNPAAPDVPTFRESGIAELKDYVQEAWYGFGGPAGIPDKVVARLARDIERALALPEVRDKLRSAGLEPSYRGPRQMRAMMQAEAASFREITAAAGITAE